MGMTTAWTNPTSAPFNCPESDGVFPLSPNACVAEYYICVSGNAYLSVINPIICKQKAFKLSSQSFLLLKSFIQRGYTFFFYRHVRLEASLIQSSLLVFRRAHLLVCVSHSFRSALDALEFLVELLLNHCASASAAPETSSTSEMTTTTMGMTTAWTNPSSAPFLCPNPDGVFPLTSSTCASEYYICVSGNAYLSVKKSGGSLSIDAMLRLVLIFNSVRKV